MNTKLVNELNEMITKLTAMRDDLDPMQSTLRTTTSRGSSNGMPIRDFPKNEALESQGVAKPQTWEDHTASYVQATIRHIEVGGQFALPSQHTLKADGMLELLIKVGESIEDLEDNNHQVVKVIMESHSGLKDSHKQNNTGDVQ